MTNSLVSETLETRLREATSRLRGNLGWSAQNLLECRLLEEAADTLTTLQQQLAAKEAWKASAVIQLETWGDLGDTLMGFVEGVWLGHQIQDVLRAEVPKLIRAQAEELTFLRSRVALLEQQLARLQQWAKHRDSCQMIQPTKVLDWGRDADGHTIGFRNRTEADGPPFCQCGLTAANALLGQQITEAGR